jgi:hypothetical protein
LGVFRKLGALVVLRSEHPPAYLDSKTVVMVRLDVRGQVVSLRREEAERLCAAAASAAPISSRRRDLALVLEWALASSRIVALRRSEARELAAVLAEDPSLSDLGQALGATSERHAA